MCLCLGRQAGMRRLAAMLVRHGLLVVVGVALVVVGCGRAIDRPLRGAAPGSETAPTAIPGVPPTLAPSQALRALPNPSPSPGAAASSVPSPSPAASAVASPSAVSMPPIVRTIAPANNGRVPAGAPVTVSAVLVGRGADLASATLQIDGAEASPQIDKRTA